MTMLPFPCRMQQQALMWLTMTPILYHQIHQHYLGKSLWILFINSWKFRFWPLGACMITSAADDLICHVVPEDTQGDEAVKWLLQVFSLQQHTIPVKWYTLIHWVVPENIHTPPMDGILEILAGGGSMTLEIQMGRGLNLKKSSAAVILPGSSCYSNI